MTEKRMESGTRRRFRAPLVVAAVLAVCFVVSGIYFYQHTIIHDGKPIDIRYTDWTYQIDRVDVEDGILTMTGWCFAQLQDTKEGASGLRIILQDMHDETRRWYLRPKYGIARPDVASYFTEGKDYTYCGFELSADLEKTGIGDTDCQIIMQHDDHNHEIVLTGEYLVDGQLWFVNPETFQEPDVKGTDLEEVAADGVLRAYVPEFGLYIYQKDWKQYIMIDKNLDQEHPHDDYYQFYALGVRRSWEDFDFDGEELCGYFSQDTSAKGMDTGHYRVIVKDIPETFPVAWLEFGLFNPEKTLDAYPRFFPRYDFGM